MTRTLLLLMSFAGFALSAAEDVNPTGPVIFYDGFERASKYWANGTLTNEKSTRPESQSRKLAAAPDKKSAFVQLKINEMKGVKLLGPAPAAAISVGFFIYGSGLKAVRVEFGGKESFAFTEDTIADDKWTEIACTVAQATAGKERKKPPADFEMTSIKIIAIPKVAGAPTVYVDDFILTVGTSPRAAWPQMIATDTQRANRTASLASDGFEYSEAMDESLREQLKSAQRKPAQKGVLSIALGKSADAMNDALKVVAAKRALNLPNPPEGQKLATAADVRLFLPAIMKGDGNDFVVFNFPAHNFTLLNAAEAVVISQRCTSVGAVPIWIIPMLPPGASPTETKKFEENRKRVEKEFAAHGVPYVSSAHALKDCKDAWDGEDLKPDACKAIAKLTESAITHTEKNTKGRL